MDAYESINKILVHLFNDIWELEEKAVITEEFKDLTNNDMHIIEAIGLGTGNNMSTIAKKLGITVGSLTTSMNSLVNKKYAVRHRSEEDRRIVNIQLTEKGEKAYHHHANFHKKMVEAVVETLDEEEIPVLTKALDNLYQFFKTYNGYNEQSSVTLSLERAGRGFLDFPAIHGSGLILLRSAHGSSELRLHHGQLYPC